LCGVSAVPEKGEAAQPALLSGAGLQIDDVSVHATASQLIHAAPERVSAIYRDYDHWPQLFPGTIRGTRLIRENDTTKAIEVDHTKAGKVLNLLTVLSPEEIRLEEFKPHYDARFTNRFDADESGTRFTVIADVQLKGVLRLFAPIAKSIVRRRIAKFVLEPIKTMAEGNA
jgi:polyketide cyclase/dehydrase/lipid transport protein